MGWHNFAQNAGTAC